MSAIILVVLLAGGPVDSVSMQSFDTTEACEVVGKWLVAEQYTKKANGAQASISWGCFKSDWKPVKEGQK